MKKMWIKHSDWKTFKKTHLKRGQIKCVHLDVKIIESNRDGVDRTELSKSEVQSQVFENN
jgi:hypothetical protein